MTWTVAWPVPRSGTEVEVWTGEKGGRRKKRRRRITALGKKPVSFLYRKHTSDLHPPLVFSGWFSSEEAGRKRTSDLSRSLTRSVWGQLAADLCGPKAMSEVRLATSWQRTYVSDPRVKNEVIEPPERISAARQVVLSHSLTGQ